jgi:hypothetical protein
VAGRPRPPVPRCSCLRSAAKTGRRPRYSRFIGLFKRKVQGGPQVVDAGDHTCVVVPLVPTTHRDTHLRPLATRAGARVGEPVAGFIERAQQGAYGSVLGRHPDSDGTSADPAHWLACMAAKLGYATRVCEFEAELLADFSDVNQYLTYVLENSHRRRTLGAGWFETLCSTAERLMSAVGSAPYAVDVAQLLAPTGLGHDAHVVLCSWLINGLRASPEAQERMNAGANELSDRELSDCWMYGYYLRGCENALPDEARQELANVVAR